MFSINWYIGLHESYFSIRSNLKILLVKLNALRSFQYFLTIYIYTEALSSESPHFDESMRAALVYLVSPTLGSNHIPKDVYLISRMIIHVEILHKK